MAKKQKLNHELVSYIDQYILPIYENFDKGHQKDHIQAVWENSQEIIADNKLDVNLDMVYTVAHYHDTGLAFNREEHHLYSGKLLLADRFLRDVFTNDEIVTMAIAAEDHRASLSETPPRNIYGQIVADGDRQINIDTIVKRYCFAVFSKTCTDIPARTHTLNKNELFDEFVYPHICTKYGGGGKAGHLKLNFKQSNAQKELDHITNMKKDEVFAIYDKYYDRIAQS